MRPVVTFIHEPQEREYTFLWLYHVFSVNVDSHCQKCLIGKKDDAISTRYFGRSKLKRRVSHYPLPAGYAAHYLCGIAKPKRWEDNLHIAFMHYPGECFTVREPGCVFEVIDAVRLYIREDYVDESHPRFQERRYRTCRNLQFAWGFRKGLYVPGGAGVSYREQE